MNNRYYHPLSDVTAAVDMIPFSVDTPNDITGISILLILFIHFHIHMCTGKGIINGAADCGSFESSNFGAIMFETINE